MKASQSRPGFLKRLKRLLLMGLLVAPVAVLGLWFAVHRFEWLGPLLANGLRAVVGVDAVAKLEDFAYSIEDRWNLFARKDERPKAYWAVPSGTPPISEPKPETAAVAQIAPAASSAAPSDTNVLPPFRPKDVGAFDQSWSAPGDGKWVPIVDPRRPNEAPYLYKTLIHSDRNRSWAEVFVVAVDLRRTRVHLMAGSREPKATVPEAENVERPAKIPEADHEELLGAFNGGFMTEHGNYGMMLNGVTYVPARDGVCTMAAYKDDTLRIGPWKDLKDSQADMVWYRQAPECMYSRGEIHPLLKSEHTRKWGATLDGDTVIRRSAVGLSMDRQILYVGISNHTMARVMADGMHHAGAADVAQMDVNWSYPKFVLFEPKDGDPKRKAVALAEGFEFSEDEYIRQRNRRDFFYLMRRAPGAP